MNRGQLQQEIDQVLAPWGTQRSREAIRDALLSVIDREHERDIKAIGENIRRVGPGAYADGLVRAINLLESRRGNPTAVRR